MTDEELLEMQEEEEWQYNRYLQLRQEEEEREQYYENLRKQMERESRIDRNDILKEML